MAEPVKARRRRELRLAKQALPCPICGSPPEIDLGLLGAEHESGMEFFSCAVFMRDERGILRQHNVYAQGLAAWNLRKHHG